MINSAAQRKKKKGRNIGGGTRDVKLPPLNSAYLRPPKVDPNNQTRLKQMLEGYSSNNKKLCGICGSIHAPGEPHKMRKASQFNSKTGHSRLSSNPPAPRSMEPIARTRGTDPERRSARNEGLQFRRRK